MSVNTEIISKGIYGRAQMSGYISVKQYMFIRYAGKKHLIVRFSNDLDVAIERLSYTVVQTNVNGDVIDVSRVDCCARVKSGDSFSSETALVVDESCTDVKITVDKAVSGAYEYSVRGGIVTVSYNTDALNGKTLKPPKLISSPNKGKNKATPKMTAVAVIAIVTVLLINLLSAFAPIIMEELFPSSKVVENDAPDKDTMNYEMLYVPYDEIFNDAE